jgi:hypothetical protein
VSDFKKQEMTDNYVAVTLAEILALEIVGSKQSTRFFVRRMVTLTWSALVGMEFTDEG